MTGAPQMYVRRCNGYPAEKLVSRGDLETVLAVACAVPGVTTTGSLDTGLSVRIPAGRPWEVETPGTVARTFTYEPVPTGRRRANTNSTTATATDTGPNRAMMEGEA